MKRFFCSVYTKVGALALAVVCLLCGINTYFGFGERWESEEIGVYNFEENFDDTSYFDVLLNDVVMCVYDAFSELYSSEDMLFNEIMEAKLEEIENDKVNYYIMANENVFANCEAAQAEDVVTNSFYAVAERDYEGNYTYKGADSKLASFFERINKYETGEVTIAACIRDEYVESTRILWEEQKAVADNEMVKMLVLFAAAFVITIYLIAVAGIKVSGRLTARKADEVWTEVQLAGAAAAVFAFFEILNYLENLYYFADAPIYILKRLSMAGAVGVYLTMLMFVMWTVRKMRCGAFFRTSVLLKIIIFVLPFVKLCLSLLAKGVEKLIGMYKEKPMVINTIIFALYTVAVGICGLLAYENIYGVVLGSVMLAVGCFVKIMRERNIAKIKREVSEMKIGNAKNLLQ